jgi:hypothetical protein
MNVTYTHTLQQILSLLIHIQRAALRILTEIQRRNLRHILIFPLALLLLKLKRDTSNGATLNPLHQVGRVPSDLVAETLGGNDGDFIADALVDFEVEGEFGVVAAE